jgi:AraC family transcriptional regulator
MLSKKILVFLQVESSCDYCKFLERNVEFCAGAKSAEKLGNLETDLVILDCAFEMNDCIELLKNIKLTHPGIPVIVVSGFGSEDFVINALKNGARDIFKRPLNGKELRKTVDTILWLRQESFEKRNALSLINIEDAREKLRLSDDIPENIVRAIVYIENNISLPLNLDNIAGEACMSKFHFCRIFKKFVGITPMQYAINMRLKKAMTLLQREELSISTVALKSGFRDLSEFNKQFKKLYGSSPSVFRDAIRAKR